MRQAYEDSASGAQLPPGTTRSSARLGSVPVEWIGAPGAREDAAIFYLHGGGFVMGSLSTHRALCARLSAAAGCRVVSVGYRLAPESPFPAALEDVGAAYRALVEERSGTGSIVVAGDSAGAGLGLAALIDAREAGLAPPAGLIAFSPWIDLALTGPSIRLKAPEDPIVTEGTLRSMAEAYLGPVTATDPRASPLYADLSGLPPMLVQVGTAELLLDDALRLADRARRRGVESDVQVYPELFHVWQAFAGLLPEADEALARAGDFARKRLGA